MEEHRGQSPGYEYPGGVGGAINVLKESEAEARRDGIDNSVGYFIELPSGIKKGFHYGQLEPLLHQGGDDNPGADVVVTAVGVTAAYKGYAG